MAKLQKKKSVVDKLKKKEDDPSGAASKNSEGSVSMTGASVQAQSSRSVFKNVKTMTAQAVAEGELNPFQKGVQFLKEVQAELAKVTWPNRKQTAGSTLVVIVLVFIVAAFLGLVDVTLSKLVQVVLA